MASLLRPALRTRALAFGPARIVQSMGIRTSARPAAVATQSKLLASVQQKKAQIPTPAFLQTPSKVRPTSIPPVGAGMVPKTCQSGLLDTSNVEQCTNCVSLIYRNPPS
jgi:hypothetical protein